MSSAKEVEKFQRGLAHFNSREFFEAHEVWEELWLCEPEPEKTFLQGLIQLAAAFHHYGRGNLRGAESLLTAGTIKLGRFPGDHGGLALAELRAQAREWVQLLAAGQNPGSCKLPKIQLVPKAKAPTKPARKKKKSPAATARR